MSYVDSTLLPDEQVTFRTSIHWSIFIRSASVVLLGLAFLIAGYHVDALRVVGGVFILAGGAFWLSAYIQRRTSEFAVTNKRIIVKVGILRRRTIELLLRQVEALEVSQSIFGRIFGYGTLLVIGTGGTREPFDRISAPLEFRRAAQAASTAQ
jgi:uncharacterized membrane protein YdbT with pleckstrin-like domain